MKVKTNPALVVFVKKSGAVMIIRRHIPHLTFYFRKDRLRLLTILRKNANLKEIANRRGHAAFYQRNMEECDLRLLNHLFDLDKRL